MTDKPAKKPKRSKTTVEKYPHFAGWIQWAPKGGWVGDQVFKRYHDAARPNRWRGNTIVPVPVVHITPMLDDLAGAAKILQDAGHPLGDTLAALDEHTATVNQAIVLHSTTLGAL